MWRMENGVVVGGKKILGHTNEKSDRTRQPVLVCTTLSLSSPIRIGILDLYQPADRGAVWRVNKRNYTYNL